MKIIETNFTYRKPLTPLNLNDVNYIIIHHPAWKSVTPHEIHIDVLTDPLKKDWNGFPYNEFVTKDGTVYIGRGDNIGAQCQGYNSISYGICCEGNYNEEVYMPEAQKSALVERIKYNRARFKNYKATVPHWQLSSDTECPGKYFPMAELLKRIEVIKMTLDEAIAMQVEEGVINSPDYRKKVCDTTIFEKEYVISVANKLCEKNHKIQILEMQLSK